MKFKHLLVLLTSYGFTLFGCEKASHPEKDSYGQSTMCFLLEQKALLSGGFTGFINSEQFQLYCTYCETLNPLTVKHCNNCKHNLRAEGAAVVVEFSQ